MKKLAIALALVAAFAVAASAQMDQYVLESSSITTNVGTDSVVLAGEIYSIYLDSPASKTNGVAIKDSLGNTVLSVAALTADGLYYPVTPRHSTAGAALTIVDNGSNTNAVYGPIAVVSTLTMTVTPDAGTTGTNTTKAYITFKK